MQYQIVLIHGGEYSNIDAPLVIQAKNFASLQDEICEAFELRGEPGL